MASSSAPTRLGRGFFSGLPMASSGTCELSLLPANDGGWTSCADPLPPRLLPLPMLLARVLCGGVAAPTPLLVPLASDGICAGGGAAPAPPPGAVTKAGPFSRPVLSIVSDGSARLS